MVVGLVPGLVVGLREGVEAALVVGIVMAYLRKIGQDSLRRYVYIGTLAAVVASVAIAAAFAVFVGKFEETAGGMLFEGFAAILAVVVLTSMIFWMMNAAKDIRQHVERRIETLVDRRQVMGLASLAFVAVFREGVETVLFMAGLAGFSTTTDVTVGVGIGLLAAVFVGYGVFAASWRVDLRRFFQATSLLLVVIAAGLFALGVHELQDAGVLPWLSGPTYDLTQAFPDGEANPFGYLLRGLVGYNDNPTQLEVVAYGAYWAFAALVYWGIRSGKIAIVTRPLRAVWAALRRASRPSPADPRLE